MAYFGLADYYIVLPDYSPVSAAATAGKAREAAQKALAIDASSSQAQAVLAGAEQNLWDWDAAEKEFPPCDRARSKQRYRASVVRPLLSAFERRDQEWSVPKGTRNRSPELVFNVNLAMDTVMPVSTTSRWNSTRRLVKSIPCASCMAISRSPRSRWAIMICGSRSGENPPRSTMTRRTCHRRGDGQTLCEIRIPVRHRPPDPDWNQDLSKAPLLSIRPRGVRLLLDGMEGRRPSVAGERRLPTKSEGMQSCKVVQPLDKYHSDPRYADLIKRMNLPATRAIKTLDLKLFREHSGPSRHFFAPLAVKRFSYLQHRRLVNHPPLGKAGKIQQTTRRSAPSFPSESNHSESSRSPARASPRGR